MGAVYRTRQFFAALRPRVTSAERALVADHLTPAEHALFLRLPPAYQRHSVAVWQRLRAQGERNPDLLRAALLHDVGKSRAQLTLGHRVLIVLLERFAPGVLRALARGEGASGWRAAFQVHDRHALIGARLAADAGAPEVAITLIANHHCPPSPRDDDALRALRRADGLE
ncbi:MAG: HD domain-containing protein [Chloroflexota bacterium]